MNTMLSSIRCHHITTVVLSLLMVALIAGATGCVGEVTRTVKYDLTIASSQGGSVSEPGEGTFICDSGRVVDLVAVPTSGFRFDRWTGDVDTIANVNAASTAITMSGNYSIRATFEETEATFYTLTVGITGSGETSPTAGQHTYSAGTVVTITATAGSGYRFVQWTGDVATIDDPDSARTTITIYGAYSITANFEQTVVTYYTLTMAATGSGSTSPALGQHTYTAGTAVPVSASPTSGYYFSHWTAPAGSFANANSATTTFTMPAQDVTVTANFAVTVPYTLTMAVTGSGSTSPAVGQHTYTAGTPVPISASPTSGYYFSHWTAPAGSFANANSATTTFTMPAQAVTVTAHFELVPTYALTMAVTPPASGTATDQTGAGPYQAGAQVNIKAQAAAGHYFVNWTAPAGSFGSVSAAQTTFTMPAQAVTVTAHFEWINFMVSAGERHTVGVRSDGTVVAVGDNSHGQCNVGSWTNIVQVGAGDYRTVGLKSDGTVVAVGANDYGECNVGGWTNMVQVSTGGYHTVGLRSNGTVAAVGDNGVGQCNVGSWTNIVQIAAGLYHTVGIKSDGTAVAVGYNDQGQCNVSSWTNIVQVAAGLYHTVGIKSDGTVVAVGYNNLGQCNVGGWMDIVHLAAGWYHTAGTKSDGTVVAVGPNWWDMCNVSSWADIVQVGTGAYHTVGVKSDGKVVAVGANLWGQCYVGDWDLN